MWRWGKWDRGSLCRCAFVYHGSQHVCPFLPPCLPLLCPCPSSLRLLLTFSSYLLSSLKSWSSSSTVFVANRRRDPRTAGPSRRRKHCCSSNISGTMKASTSKKDGATQRKSPIKRQKSIGSRRKKSSARSSSPSSTSSANDKFRHNASENTKMDPSSLITNHHFREVEARHARAKQRSASEEAAHAVIADSPFAFQSALSSQLTF